MIIKIVLNFVVARPAPRHIQLLISFLLILYSVCNIMIYAYNMHNHDMNESNNDIGTSIEWFVVQQSSGSSSSHVHL